MMNLFTNRRQECVVGLDVRADSLAVTQVLRRERRAEVQFCEFHPAAAGEHAEILDGIVRRRRLKGSRCVAVVSEDRYELLQVETPQVPKAEQRDAIRWKIRDMIDFPVEQAAIEVFDMPTGSNRQQRHLNAVVCNAASVQELAALTRNSRLKLHAIDIPELSQRNIVNELAEPGAGIALLSFREQHGMVTLVRDGELFLARELETGLASLREAQHDAAMLGAAHANVVLELQRSFDYYESNFAMPPIARLLVHPPTAEVHELVAHVRGQMNTGAEVVSLDRIAGACEMPNECLNALGAALRCGVL